MIKLRTVVTKLAFLLVLYSIPLKASSSGDLMRSHIGIPSGNLLGLCSCLPNAACEKDKGVDRLAALIASLRESLGKFGDMSQCMDMDTLMSLGLIPQNTGGECLDIWLQAINPFRVLQTQNMPKTMAAGSYNTCYEFKNALLNTLNLRLTGGWSAIEEYLASKQMNTNPSTICSGPPAPQMCGPSPMTSGLSAGQICGSSPFASGMGSGCSNNNLFGSSGFGGLNFSGSSGSRGGLGMGEFSGLGCQQPSSGSSDIFACINRNGSGSGPSSGGMGGQMQINGSINLPPPTNIAICDDPSANNSCSSFGRGSQNLKFGGFGSKSSDCSDPNALLGALNLIRSGGSCNQLMKSPMNSMPFDMGRSTDVSVGCNDGSAPSCSPSMGMGMGMGMGSSSPVFKLDELMKRSISSSNICNSRMNGVSDNLANLNVLHFGGC